MKITKTQLQNIIREELDALSEDEQLDEFFGPFSKKAKARKARIAKQKADAEEDRRQSAADAEEAAAGEAAREAERNSPEYKEMQRKASLTFGMGRPQKSDTRANNIALDRQRREKELQRRKSMERDRAAGRNKTDYARKTQYYGVNNRKDESKVRQRIREEVAKAVKDHFRK